MYLSSAAVLFHSPRLLQLQRRYIVQRFLLQHAFQTSKLNTIVFARRHRRLPERVICIWMMPGVSFSHVLGAEPPSSAPGSYFRRTTPPSFPFRGDAFHQASLRSSILQTQSTLKGHFPFITNSGRFFLFVLCCVARYLLLYCVPLFDDFRFHSSRLLPN